MVGFLRGLTLLVLFFLFAFDVSGRSISENKLLMASVNKHDTDNSLHDRLSNHGYGEITVPLIGIQDIIKGQVIDSETGEPLPGVNVIIKGTTTGTSTDASGNYQLSVEDLNVTLVVSFIGYHSFEVDVNGRSTVDIMLESVTSLLDEIVVTGVAGGTQRRSLGNALAKVDANEALNLAPISNVQALLGSRIAGVDITGGNGALGGGSKVRIRGNSSISLSNEPIVYIDGIRVNSDPNAGPRQTRAGFFVSRMNDLNPEDIESMEVIKGPAAATLYGTEAAGGVIQIITKKGQSGKPRLNVMLRSGFNYLMDPEGRIPSGYRRARDGSGDLIEWHIVTQEKERGTINDTFIQKGLIQTYSANLSGGSDNIQYFLGANLDNSEGFIPWNTREAMGVQTNINIKPNEFFSISGNLGYNTSDARLPQVMSPYGIWDSAIWGHSDRTANLGFYTTPPGVVPENVEMRTDLKRVTWSMTISNDPFSWLTHRLTIGQDMSVSRSPQVFKKLPSTSRQYFGGSSEGRKFLYEDTTTNLTFDYSATGNFDLTRDLNLKPSYGIQYYSRETKTLEMEGRGFPARSIESIGGAAVTLASENYLPNKTFGMYVQGLIGWKDKLFLTLAVRGDDNSAFGANYNAVIYPKASISWVASNESFFKSSLINDFKVRAAYGQSGQQPDLFAADRLYSPVTGPGDIPVLTPLSVGNPDLGPEKGEEIEIGFDANLNPGNTSVSFTYYNQTTRDAILARQLALSEGFPGTQFVNVGKVSNVGIELEASSDLIDRSNLMVNLGATLAWNKNKLVDLGGVPEVMGDFTGLIEGYTLYGYWGVEITDAELDNSGQVIMNSVMCRQEDGSKDLCVNSAPKLFKGPQTPTYQGSVNANINFFKSWTLYANVDYKLGYYRGDGDVGYAHMLQANTKAIIGSPVGKGTLETENIPGVGDMVYTRYTQSTGPDPIALAYDTDPGGWGMNLYIHDAGFFRLRELSLRYNLPLDFSQKLGVSNTSLTIAGRNLWFLYRAQKDILGRKIVDPEISRSSGYNTQTQTTLPLMSSVVLTLRIGL